MASLCSRLAARLGEIQTAPTWNEASAGLTLLLESFMGSRTTTERPEKAAVRDALAQTAHDLRHLDLVGPPPHRSLIRTVMEDGITAKGGWTGKSGTGVAIGGYPDAGARDLDVVFLIGAAEGRAPARIREDPLLPDSVRKMMGGALPSVEQRAEATREQFFAALAAGTDRTITCPRGDLRGSGSYQISRWITAKPDDELQSFAHGIENGAPALAAPPPPPPLLPKSGGSDTSSPPRSAQRRFGKMLCYSGHWLPPGTGATASSPGSTATSASTPAPSLIPIRPCPRPASRTGLQVLSATS